MWAGIRYESGSDSSVISSRWRESQTEDRSTVRAQVSDLLEARDHPPRGVEVRSVEQVMDLAGLVALLVDRRDLDLEQEADRRAAWRRHLLGDATLDVVAQAKEALLRRHQLLLQLGDPRRMREVPGADDANPLLLRPLRQVLQVALLAGRARVLRVDVKVRVVEHGAPPARRGVARRTDASRDRRARPRPNRGSIEPRGATPVKPARASSRPVAWSTDRGRRWTATRRKGSAASSMRR